MVCTQYSYGSLVLWPIGPTIHWSDKPLVLQPSVLRAIGPTSHWSYDPLVLCLVDSTVWKYFAIHPIGCMIHWSYDSLVLWLIGPMSHWPYTSESRFCMVHWCYDPVVLRASSPTVHWSYKSDPINCTDHWSYDPLVLWLIGPTFRWFYALVNWGQDVASHLLSISAKFACAVCEIMKYFIFVKYSFHFSKVGGGPVNTDIVIWKLTVSAWCCPKFGYFNHKN